MRSGLLSEKIRSGFCLAACLFLVLCLKVSAEEAVPSAGSSKEDRLSHFSEVAEYTEKNVAVSGNGKEDRLSHFSEVAEYTEKNVAVSGNGKEDRLSHFSEVAEYTEKNVAVSDNGKEDRLAHFAAVVENTGKNVKVSANESSARLSRFAALEREMEKKYGPVIEDKVLVRGEDYGEKELGIHTIRVAENKPKDGSNKRKDEAKAENLSGSRSEMNVFYSGRTDSFAENTTVFPDVKSFFTGTPQMAEISGNINKVSLGTFRLTAYDACLLCCGKTDGITATGTLAKEGRTIAVDPRIIPYGSRVMINGNIYTAEDTGSAIKGNAIDVYLTTHEKARQFGVKYAEVFLLK